MPLYTFQCQSCGGFDSAFRKIDQRDDAPQCAADGQQMHRIVDAPYVAPDINPYQAVAVDVATGRPPVIGSRSQHREFLKRNGYVEVGNDVAGLSRKPGEVRGDFNVRGELTQATREVLGKQR